LGNTRRYAHYEVLSQQPFTFEVVRRLLTVQRALDDPPWIEECAFWFPAGPGRYAPRNIGSLEELWQWEATQTYRGFSHSYLRLCDHQSPSYGYISIREYVSTRGLSVNFKEYEAKLSNAFVSKCLRSLADLPLMAAEGETGNEKVVSVLCLHIDIRGFSDFCSFPDIESHDAGKLIRLFQRLVETQFIDTMESLRKHLGDGCLLVWAESEVDLDEVVRTVLPRLILLQQEFRRAVRSKYSNMECPSELGCGLARGSALQIPDDFIGRPVNLAIRLSSKARPNGICADSRTIIDSQVFKGWSVEEITDMKGFEKRTVWKTTF